ncbi:MAG TPA: NAD(P)/FAD-dependent oxidoreductase [Gaiellaceae bacterium]|nr:NAD(P)/FAD-dependent oxidoreductase [Gaiellaceae bacterium]
MREHFDLIVIGGGSAARDAAGKAAREYDARVALVEKERWGGSCPNVACTPTKAYLVVAELAHDINDLAAKLGIDAGSATVDLARVKARKDTLKKPQEQWVSDLEAQGFTIFTSSATLVDAHTVQAGDQVLEGDRILIATGSRTAVPPIEGIDDVGWIDHISALELTELPDSLLVVGAGAVGLEFGQAFARFGSKVTIVDALERIAPLADAEASATLTSALEEEGIEIVPSAFVKSVRRDGDDVVAMLAPRDGSPERELRVARIMLASGRVPNIEGLNLDAAGIESSKPGIAVDERMRTSVPGVWAAGDVNAVAQFTPVAQYQARIAVADMFGEEAMPADYSILPTSIFTDPELAGVGLTGEQAEEQGYDVEVARNAFVRRFSYIDARHGLFKIVFDRASRRVLGLHVVSRNAGDVVQGFSLALKLGATVEDIAAMHHVFPTFGEGVKGAAEQAAAAPEASMVVSTAL